jgi:Zn-dependent protease with chaperone function
MDKPHTPAGRLNPFAFPSETDVRFRLLIFAVLMMALNISTALPYLFVADTTNPFAAIPPAPLAPPNGEINADYVHDSQIWGRQIFDSTLKALALPVGLALGIFALASLIYSTHPRRILRQKNLTTLPETKDPTFHAEVCRLARIADLPHTPAIALQPGFKSKHGQAFGLRDRYIVRLGSGLRLLLRKKPMIFRAIVLHEFAHIANRDVARTYFARAIWFAVLALAIAPLGLGMLTALLSSDSVRSLNNPNSIHRLLTINIPQLLLIGLQAGTVIVTVFIIFAGLLRVRERYADWRTVLWGAEGGLVVLLEENELQTQTRKPSWLRLHPTPKERLDILRDPLHLFQIAPDLPLTVGILSAFIIGGMVAIILPLGLIVMSGGTALRGALVGPEVLAQGGSNTQPHWSIDLLMIAPTIGLVGMIVLPIAVMAYLTSSTVGVQLQRQAIADLAFASHGWNTYLKLWRSAALIALGMILGFVSTPPSPLLNPTDLQRLGVVSLWMLGSTVLIWLCLAYSYKMSRSLLGAHLGKTPPEGKRRLLTLTLSILLCPVYVPITVQAITGTIALDATTRSLANTLSTAALGVALLVYVGVVGVSWASLWVKRRVRLRHCPTCKHAFRTHTFRRYCGQCGEQLRVWMFVPIGAENITDTDRVVSA